MKLPSYEHATVADRKITGYLLSSTHPSTHPSGSSKARYFTRHGFSADDWQALAEALRRHAAENEVAETAPTPRGVSYKVEGELVAPTGSRLRIRAAWFQDVGSKRHISSRRIR